MSVASRRALYGRMAGDTTLDSLLETPAPGFSHSVYYEVAPASASFPYVIFSKQAGTPDYSLGGRNFENEVWLVKAVDRSDSADGVDGVASRLDTLLTDAVLSISGKTHLYLRRESDVDYSETVDGETYRHAGALYRLIYT